MLRLLSEEWYHDLTPQEKLHFRVDGYTDRGGKRRFYRSKQYLIEVKPADLPIALQSFHGRPVGPRGPEEWVKCWATKNHLNQLNAAGVLYEILHAPMEKDKRLKAR